MGRKKYEERLEPDNLTRLNAWARDGLTEDQIAHNMGIARSTLWERKKNHPDISNALKRGKEVTDIFVENALYRRAIGYNATDEHIVYKYEDGVPIPVEKTVNKRHIPGDITAQIRWLKNRKSDVRFDRKYKEMDSGTDEKLKEYFEKLDGEVLDES